MSVPCNSTSQQLRRGPECQNRGRLGKHRISDHGSSFPSLEDHGRSEVTPPHAACMIWWSTVVDNHGVAGIAQPSAPDDPAGLRVVAAGRLCTQNHTTGRKTVGNREGAMLGGRHSSHQVAVDRPRSSYGCIESGRVDGSLERHMVEENMKALRHTSTNPDRQIFNRGSRALGKRQWDDAVQKTAGVVDGEVQWYQVAEDCEL